MIEEGQRWNLPLPVVKKEYDKRHDIAKRDADRRMQQAMRKHS